MNEVIKSLESVIESAQEDGMVVGIRIEERKFSVGDVFPCSKSTNDRIGVYEDDADLLDGTCAYKMSMLEEIIRSINEKTADFSNAYIVAGYPEDCYIQDIGEIVLSDCTVIGVLKEDVWG